MNDLLLLHNIPKDCIHLVVKDVVLQAVQVLHSDLDVIVDKTLHVGGPDTAIIMASRQPNKDVNIRKAQEGLAPSHTTPAIWIMQVHSMSLICLGLRPWRKATPAAEAGALVAAQEQVGGM